jgi:hypothetical protein
MAPLQPVRATAIAIPPATASAAPVVNALWDRLAEAVEHPIRVSPPVTIDSALVGKLFTEVVSLLDSDLSGDASSWSPLPIDRGGNAGSLAHWIALPYEGPERMILSGVRMSVELGQRTRRRSTASRNQPSGDGSELFQVACGLFSSGTRTLLMTRWQSGGAVQEALVREFASEMNNLPADEAWQRSVRLARAMQLDPGQEPRFRQADEAADLPTADHPFFWSGFILFDTGRDPRAKDEEPVAEKPVVAVEKKPAEAAPMPMPPAPPVPRQPTEVIPETSEKSDKQID